MLKLDFGNQILLIAQLFMVVLSLYLMQAVKQILFGLQNFLEIKQKMEEQYLLLILLLKSNSVILLLIKLKIMEVQFII